jgi:peptide/nickel transport system substrate-binding protein
MRKLRKPLALAAALAFTVAACGGGDSAVSPTSTAAGTTVATTPVVTAAPAPDLEATYGGSITIGIEAETAGPWIPASMQCASSCQMVSRTFFDSLVVVNTDLEAEPFLLESYSANDDDTIFTLKVRSGIEFHDGTPLNAEAVIDNLNRGGLGFLIAPALKDLARNPDGTFVIEVLDDLTFTMQTGFNGDPSEPISWPLFPYYLGGQWGLIASPTWLAAVDAGEASPTEPVGTGAFKMESYAPGDRTVVVRNDSYWLNDVNGNQLPYLDRIEFRVIQDSQVRQEALKSGDLTVMQTSDSTVIGPLSAAGDFGYLNQDQYAETNYLLFNLTLPKLQSREVRCALLQAIDPVDYHDVVNDGYGEISNGPFTPGQEGYLDDNGRLPYDPDAARAAIAAWEDENGPLNMVISTTPTVTNLRAAQYLLDVWGEVGVDVSIDQIEQSTLITNALLGLPSFEVFGWRNHAGLFADSQYFWWHGSAALPPGNLALNFGRLNDPVINELLEKSRSESDPQVRLGYAEDMNRRFASECFVIPTSQTQWGIFFDSAVQNLGRQPTPSGTTFARDGAGFPGQVFLSAVFLAD